MAHIYQTSRTCSKSIRIEVEEGIVQAVEFAGGCQGNLQGIGCLVKGMRTEDVISRLEGIDCGGKGTSCPDQLAKALKELK